MKRSTKAVKDILAGIPGHRVAAPTLRRYLQHYRQAGPEGLRDLLRLPVSRETVRQVLVRYGLNRLGQHPMKPVQPLVAAAPSFQLPGDQVTAPSLPGAARIDDMMLTVYSMERQSQEFA